MKPATSPNAPSDSNVSSGGESDSGITHATQMKMNAEPTVQATRIDVSTSPMTGSEGATRK